MKKCTESQFIMTRKPQLATQLGMFKATEIKACISFTQWNNSKFSPPGLFIYIFKEEEKLQRNRENVL